MRAAVEDPERRRDRRGWICPASRRPVAGGFSTVRSDTSRRVAIDRLDAPAAASVATSRSRGVRRPGAPPRPSAGVAAPLPDAISVDQAEIRWRWRSLPAAANAAAAWAAASAASTRRPERIEAPGHSFELGPGARLGPLSDLVTRGPGRWPADVAQDFLGWFRCAEPHQVARHRGHHRVGAERGPPAGCPLGRGPSFGQVAGRRPRPRSGSVDDRLEERHGA